MCKESQVIAAIRAAKGEKRVFLTPQQVGPIVGWNPQYIREAARTNSAVLPWPVIVRGRRTEIPKIPFLAWCCENMPHYFKEVKS